MRGRVRGGVLIDMPSHTSKAKEKDDDKDDLRTRPPRTARLPHPACDGTHQAASGSGAFPEG